MTESPTVRVASDYLEENADSLVARWIEWVRERVPTETTTALPERALRNHIPPILRSLAKFIRSPMELTREELLGHLRLHGEIRRDQGYSLQEVLAEFDGLADLVTRGVNEALRGSSAFGPDVLEVSTRLATGLRSISFIAMGTFTQSSFERDSSMSESLEEFARAVSHELRNPLNTISLGLQVIRSDGADREQMLRQIEVMESAVKRSCSLLDAILALAVTEGARALPHLKSFADGVNMIFRELNETAGNGSVELRVAEDLPMVNVETVLLHLVLINVVGNAIKYSDPAKEVRWVSISGHVEDEENDSGFLEIRVEDNGIGIPAEHVSRVCQRGLRVHPDHAEGTGLGLYIVSQAVTSRGGSIVVESEEGQGTQVTIKVRCLDPESGALTAENFRVENLMGHAIRHDLKELDGETTDRE
ncbi:MAG: HAMP domain-containing sensor histidine kinase [Planctomycetota bacterium]